MAASNYHSEAENLPSQLYFTVPELTLESGVSIRDAVISLTFNGMLNAQRDNAIVICHPFSESADVESWWPSVTSTFDPSQYCIICCNCVGSPYGSAGPLSYKPITGPRRPRRETILEVYGDEFPKTTFKDDIRMHKYVLDVLGVRSVHCVVGIEMGGIHALEWASLGLRYIRSIILISTPILGKGHSGYSPSSSGARSTKPSKLSEDLYSKQEPHDHIRGILKNIWKQMFEPVAMRNSRVAASVESSYYGLAPLREHSACIMSDKPGFDEKCHDYLSRKIHDHSMLTKYYELPGGFEESVRKTFDLIEQPALIVGIRSTHLCPPKEHLRLFKAIQGARFAILGSTESSDCLPKQLRLLDNILSPFVSSVWLQTDVSSQDSELSC